MLINRLSIVCVLLLGFSCKKEDTTFDREESIEKDTATIIYSLTQTASSLTNFQFDIEMLTLNELESEQNYTGLDFSPYYSNSDLDYTVTNESIQTLSSTGEYSTVVLLDLSNEDYLDRENVGIYLRRYFETVDSLSLRHLAFSSFTASDNHETRFHAEKPNDIFGNSWQYNTSTYYQLRQAPKTYGSSVSLVFFKHRIMDAMDTLLAANPLGSLSITAIVGAGGFVGENQSDYLEIINKAKINNIKINIISQHNDGDIQTLATETGGFFSSHDLKETVQNGGTNIEDPNSPTKTSLLNLDKLLRSEVRAHRMSINVNASNGSTFQSGSNYTAPFEYGGYVKRINFIIP